MNGEVKRNSPKCWRWTNSFCKQTAQWTQLKAVVKNWTTGHRNNCISVPAELIILLGRRRVVAYIITDFSGTNSWCYRFMKKCKRSVMSFKKENITPILGSNEGSAMFEKGKSLNSNNSNDECNGRVADFRGLYYQKNLHTALPLC